MMTATLSPAGLAGSRLAPSSSFVTSRARVAAAVRPAVQVKAQKAVVASLDKRAEDVAEGARKMYEKIATPALSLALAATLMGGVVPDDAFAAKSSGRVGGRNFSGSSAQTRQAPAQRTTVNNVYVAPSVGFSPFGFSPFGFSPFGFSPFGFGFGFMSFSTLLSLIAFGLVANFVLGAMSAAADATNKDKKKDDDFFE